MGLLAVAMGGAIGAVARYGLSGWLHAATGLVFPVGTLAVNVAGSFLIGLVLHLATGRFILPLEARLFLTIGLCGGLTTLSTFSYETFALLEEQQWLAAGGNTFLNVALCLVSTYLGIVAARIL